jgi:hypothetical protein
VDGAPAYSSVSVIISGIMINKHVFSSIDIHGGRGYPTQLGALSIMANTY